MACWALLAGLTLATAAAYNQCEYQYPGDSYDSPLATFTPKQLAQATKVW